MSKLKLRALRPLAQTMSPFPPRARARGAATAQIPRPQLPVRALPANDEDAQVSDTTRSQHRAGRRSPERQTGWVEHEGGQRTGEEARGAWQPSPGCAYLEPRLSRRPAAARPGAAASPRAEGAARGGAPRPRAPSRAGVLAGLGWAAGGRVGAGAGVGELRGAAVGSPPSAVVRALRCACGARPPRG